MSAQLGHPLQPAAAPQLHPSGVATRPDRLSRPHVLRSTGSVSSARDRDRGTSLLFAFAAATAVIVADVVVIAAVGESWILIPGVAVHLLMSGIVLWAIVRLLSDGAEAKTGHAR